MRLPFHTLRAALAAWAVHLRRSRNARAGRRGGHGPARRMPWRVLLACMLAGAGAAVIAGHALGLSELDQPEVADAGIARYRAALPGAVIEVPARRGAAVQVVAGGAVLTLNNMQGHPPQRTSLCSLLRADGAMQPLRVGYRFDELAAQGRPLHHAMLAAADVPAVRIDGAQQTGGPLRVRWRGRAAAWVADAEPGGHADDPAAAAGAGRLRRHGWLVWQQGALRFEHRALASCPQAGELLVQLYRPHAEAAARCCKVIAFAAHGGVQAGWLPPGRHPVPAAPAAPPDAQEDQALFTALQSHGLLRLASDGALEVAPPDVLAWAAAAPQDRVASPLPWGAAVGSPDAVRLLKRLYRQADGAYVLRQIAIYNSERQVVAWRTPLDGAGQDGSRWQALADGAPLPVTGAMPGAAARLFAELPQGWAPWQRPSGWPPTASLSLVHAGGGGILRLMVAGKVEAVHGARIAARRDACSGTGCAAPADVTELSLAPDGAGPVTVAVRPLPAAVAAGDARYRHIDVAQGVPVWRALGDGGVPRVAQGGSGLGADSGKAGSGGGSDDAGGNAGGLAQSAAAAPGWTRTAAASTARQVRIAARDGALLWSDGATTAPARAAGLAAMLGVAPDHASGIAGMLARIPGGGPQDAMLTLDLPLQARSQAIVDCIALRRGRWENGGCHGGAAPPAGRQAGLVLLDAHSGAILAAAGAGTAPAGPFNWAEVRDFDRANPARSPLRLPAWQHDGGVHRSPGSTFKVVSALGLELAAKQDRQLDALLEGMAPAAINQMAHARGYDFGTAAAAYPVGGPARITNYREQGLEHRAQDGRLGLRQALAYSQNTWFAWAAEWSDRSLLGAPEGGMPDLQPLEPGALDPVRPVAAAARRLGFGAAMRLDGGLLPDGYRWSAYDALQATAAMIDPVQTRHEVRQMAIGLRMQATPLQMALVAGAIGEGATVAPYLLQTLNGRAAQPAAPAPLAVRLDRLRAGMKAVIDGGTAAGAFGAPALAGLRRGLYGKTGTAPTAEGTATVWFTGWLEPGALPGQRRRLAFAVFASHSEASGGEHAAPVVAALLADPVVRAALID